MKFLPSLRHREPRPQAQPPPDLVGLNAAYYDAAIPFGPTPSPPHAHAHASHRHRRPPSPRFSSFLYESEYEHGEHGEDQAQAQDRGPRIVRGHRKPPTRFAKETSSPIYFAPDPPAPGSYNPDQHSPARRGLDQDRVRDHDGGHERRAPRSRELRAPGHEHTQPSGRAYLHPEEPRDRRHRSSRREPRAASPEHGYPAPRSRSRQRRHHAEAPPREVWREEPRRERRRPSPPPSPVHRPREDREREPRRRGERGARHREDRSRGPHRQHTVPPPAAAIQRAVASEWWRSPAVQAGARNALNAGAHALMRHRREEGPWLGSKGAKVAGAALGAALADGLGGDGKK